MKTEKRALIVSQFVATMWHIKAFISTLYVIVYMYVCEHVACWPSFTLDWNALNACKEK